MIRMRIALALLALVSMLAGAQVLEVTPGTACGAPGVGLVRSFASGAETWRAEVRPEGKPGTYVGRDGRWHTGCKMPPACEARPTYQWADQTSGAPCNPATKEIRAAKNVGDTAQVNAISPRGVIHGRAVYRCTADGRWELVTAETYCRRP